MPKKSRQLQVNCSAARAYACAIEAMRQAVQKIIDRDPSARLLHGKNQNRWVTVEVSVKITYEHASNDSHALVDMAADSPGALLDPFGSCKKHLDAFAAAFQALVLNSDASGAATSAS